MPHPLAALAARARSLWAGIRRPSEIDAEMRDEWRLHQELRAADLVRHGVAPAAAERQARDEFGSQARHRAAARRARGLHRVDGARVSWLDLKLGARMLVKHPGLSLVGGLGMAVAIAIGAAFFAFLGAYVVPVIPLPEGERVVGLDVWDAAANGQERQVLHDFVEWRASLRSFEALGAFRTVRRNLVREDGSAEPLYVAEITASGFPIARVPALLGRTLEPADEAPGAAPVVVLGHDVWRTRFGGDPAVVGRTIQLGHARHRVVGVMPAGYRFPVNHRVWVPLRADPARWARRDGPSLVMFGRLAPGVGEAAARAELQAVGERAARLHPATHEQLRPRVIPYSDSFGVISSGGSRWALVVVQGLVSMLLVLVAVNVAILVYARTANRQGEIAVRSALGASRRRIVAQLFLESLVLSLASAAVGLLMAVVAVRYLHGVLEGIAAQQGGLPFWLAPRIPPATLLYAVGLAVLAALISGVLPALRATGRRLQQSLRELGGGTGLRLGRTWTTLVVGQVAFAMAVLPAASWSAWSFLRWGFAEPGFAAAEYLTARLEMDEEIPATAEAERHRVAADARYAALQARLLERLAAEPGVTAAAAARDVPGQEPTGLVEVEGVRAPAAAAGAGAAGDSAILGHQVRQGRVDAAFFAAFDLAPSRGRLFGAGDAAANASPVVVSEQLVQRLLGGGNALGRRLRYVDRTGDPVADAAALQRWYVIVGVVPDFPAPMGPDQSVGRVYHPLDAGAERPVQLFVRTRGTTPAALAPRLRALTAGVDPALRPHEEVGLDELYTGGEQGIMRVGAAALALVTLSVLVLSAAGIYAMMSFTVARRRREIGVRAALGAHPARLLASVFARALRQLALGLGLGLVAAAWVDHLAGGELTGGHALVVLPLVGALMLVVGLAATWGPARRGLRIQPTEALRGE